MIAWLTDTLIATSLLMLLVQIVREPVRRMFGASVTYALWLLPAARLLMPTLTQTVERAAPAALPDVAPASFAQTSIAAAPEIPSLLERMGGWQGIVLPLWIAGAAVLLVRGLIIYRRQRRAVLAEAVQIARLDGIRIVRTYALSGPMAFGVIDRVIALPADFDGRFDERQRRLALDHELAHHRSGDIIANHVAFVLLCLQWFNPIAWLSHAAFRFDQEAACDARVLAKADGSDRAAYGQAIAKAASGRALLFSGALDRPGTLQRRLKTMLVNPNRRRRIAGRALIFLGLAAALPLTATWAVNYVDAAAPPAPAVPPTAMVAPLAPLPPLAPAVPAMAPVAPIPPLAPIAPLPPIHQGKMMIHGQERDWSELTPAEKAQMRAAMDEARRGIANVHIDRDQIRAELAAARAEIAANHGDMQRELQNSRREVAEAMREIDRNAIELRRHGQDPEALKATVRASLKAVEGIDVAAITERALASVDPATIERSLQAADEGIRRAQAAIDAAEPNN